MSVFKNIKSLFIEEDGKGEDKKVVKEEKKTKKSSTSTPVATPTPTSRPTVSGTANPEFTDKLLKVIEANNQPGFDYLEFKKTLKGMSKMNLDEPTQFKSAFAAAQTMGVTPKALMDSAQVYLKVLADEEKKFSAAVANQKDKNIVGKKQQLKNMETAITNKEAQIKKLQQEIETDKKKMADSSSAIEKMANKIEETQANFNASYSKLKDNILSDVDKMKMHLK